MSALLNVFGFLMIILFAMILIGGLGSLFQ